MVTCQARGKGGPGRIRAGGVAAAESEGAPAAACRVDRREGGAGSSGRCFRGPEGRGLCLGCQAEVELSGQNPDVQQAEPMRFGERTGKVVRDGGFRGPGEMSDPVMMHVNKTAQSGHVTERESGGLA